MTRSDLIARIINQLNQLDDVELQDLLSGLERDEPEITDETLSVVAYGTDDTTHLSCSPANVDILNSALDALQGQALLTASEAKFAILLT